MYNYFIDDINLKFYFIYTTLNYGAINMSCSIECFKLYLDLNCIFGLR